MALIAVSGHPGCRFEEVARISRAAARVRTADTIAHPRAHRRGVRRRKRKIPDKAYPSLVTSILARLATEHHMVYCAVGGELQARHFPGMLRVHVVAPENVRIGNLMLDHRLERPAARAAAAGTGSRRPRRPQSQIRQDQGHRRSVRPGAQCRSRSTQRADGGADRDRRGVHRPQGARLSFRRGRSAAAVSDAPEAGALRHRAARQGHAAQEDLRPSERGDVRQPAGFLPHRLGVRAAQLSRAVRSRRQRAGSPSRRISTCRSSICTWN